MTNTYIALGICRKRNETVLDVYYPEISVLKNNKNVEAIMGEFTLIDQLSTDQKLTCSNAYSDHLLNLTINNKSQYASTVVGMFCLTDLKLPINSVEEAYFKLQLISQRHCKPHDICLDGMFGILSNIAWTNKGPILVEDVERERIKSYESNSPLVVTHVDKFPYLVNYHVPSGTRVASGSQVRLGAHLAEGTTIMPAGYVNFNAGTLGNAMIEGRVSAGVVVGENSDIGGGASIMGTLSGGNKSVISIGQSCLLGANAGTGISMGDGCTIAAGLYIYAGMKVSLVNAKNEPH
jgi:Tetrahydrodipicolinate N-succinyltransferase